MLSLNNHDNSARFQNPHKSVSDLTCHTLLDLRSLRVQVDQPGEFRQAGDLALLIRNVAKVSTAEERHQVMLAGGVQLDVAYEDHLLVVGVEYGRQYFFRPHTQAGKLLDKGARNTRRGFPQPVPSRILANR